jgi:hypothetical protein
MIKAYYLEFMLSIYIFRHDITEILLKVVLNTIALTHSYKNCSRHDIAEI